MGHGRGWQRRYFGHGGDLGQASFLASPEEGLTVTHREVGRTPPPFPPGGGGCDDAVGPDGI